jgi:ribosomal protein S18 acetylase RimI-like enzyme
MSPIRTVSQVYDAIQQAKAGAPDFCTNFFPVQRRLQEWIDHDELQGDFRDGASFYFRRDRDFHHLYFCAASQTALKREIACMPEIKSERMVLDIVGKEADLSGLLALWESADFRRGPRLYRMVRTSQPGGSPAANGESPVAFADKADGQEILALLENTFNRYDEQLPTTYEIEAAVEARQILVARHEDRIGGLLFFETQGLSSTLRFWAVAPACRMLRFGSALMRQYFATQSAVRRFVLWVAMDNLDAVQKYRHYGYAPDGLVDYVLANALIRS